MIKKILKVGIFTWLVLLIISISFGLVYFSNESGIRHLTKAQVVLKEELKELQIELQVIEASYVQRETNYRNIHARQTRDIRIYISDISILI